MLRFNAPILCHIAGFLTRHEVMVSLGTESAADESEVAEVNEFLVLLKEPLRTYDLSLSATLTERLIGQLPLLRQNRSLFSRALSELLHRIQDEMDDKVFLYVLPHKRFVFKAPRDSGFGPEVSAAFPSALEDIEEAWRCFGCDRNTACVFHLSRVMELGLRALAGSLKDASVDPKTNPTWEKLLQRCDRELALPMNQRSAEWKAAPEFFSEATANLRAVKNAWRNPTMHVGNAYNDEKAQDILNAVAGFMRHLATQLRE